MKTILQELLVYLRSVIRNTGDLFIYSQPSCRKRQVDSCHMNFLLHVILVSGIIMQIRFIERCNLRTDYAAAASELVYDICSRQIGARHIDRIA